VPTYSTKGDLGTLRCHLRDVHDPNESSSLKTPTLNYSSFNLDISSQAQLKSNSRQYFSPRSGPHQVLNRNLNGVTMDSPCFHHPRKFWIFRQLRNRTECALVSALRRHSGFSSDQATRTTRCLSLD